jgi:hypothetical protein
VYLALGLAAHGGENPDINMYLEFTNGQNTIDPGGPGLVTATVYLENFGSGGGTTGTEFRLVRTFGGNVDSYTNLLPGGFDLGNPVDGWSLMGSCAFPDGSGRVAVGEVTYYYNGTPGTLEIAEYPSHPRTVLDCSSGEDYWCVRLDPSGHGAVGLGAVPPDGDCADPGFVPSSTLFWHDDIEGDVSGWSHGSGWTGPHFHVDTYMAWDDGEAPDYSWWCGNFDYDANGGYGNNWSDRLDLPPIDTSGFPMVALECRYLFDTELGYDYVYVEAESSGAWVGLNVNTGSGPWHQPQHDLTGFDNPLRIRFRFESDAGWSDEDTGYPSLGGAVHVDNVHVYDYYNGITLFYEDCEGGPGTTECTPSIPDPSDDWHVVDRACLSYSATHSWWCGDDGDTTQIDEYTYSYLTTPPIDILGGALACTLRYALHMRVVDYDSYVRVQVSTDLGSSWYGVATHHGYDDPECGAYLVSPKSLDSFLPADNLLVRFGFMSRHGSGPGVSGGAGVAIDDVWVYGDVSSEPEIVLEPTEFSFELCMGNSGADTLLIRNDGGADLTWSVADSCSWLAAVPDGGVVTWFESENVAVLVDAAGPELGEHTCHLVVTSDDSDEPELEVPVTLTVVPCGEPVIASVTDVSGDQGRQVRVRWARCEYDAAGDTVEITSYGIYRREDGRAVALADPGPNGLRGSRLDGWDHVATVPARGDDYYQNVVPTLCDSTAESGICWSVFMVSAETPDPLVYLDSVPDSGYSVDNLAPEVPRGLLADGDEALVALTWDPNDEEDLDYYAVYRDTTEDFAPGVPIGYTISESYEDAGPPDAPEWWYKVTAWDFNGNESEPSEPAGVVGTGVPDALPTRFWLGPAVPNPFNATTEIHYWVPGSAGGRGVELVIYDASGRMVRSLVDREIPPGTHTAMWDGRDDRGADVASGVYFYSMEAGDYSSRRKMVLLK